MLDHTQTRPVSAQCHLSPDQTPCKSQCPGRGRCLCLVFMYNEKGDESVNKLLLFYAPSKRNIVCNTKLGSVLGWAGGTEHEFFWVIIIQIESIAAWLSYEGVCFLFNYRVAAYHDEIGSGLCVERVKGGGGKLSIIAVHYYNVSPAGSGLKLQLITPSSLQIKKRRKKFGLKDQMRCIWARNSIWRLWCADEN